MTTITEVAGRLEAPELREILATHLRLTYSEKRAWFYILFTIAGEEPYLSRCRHDIDEWRHRQFMDRAW